MTVATYAAAQLLRVLPRARITRAVGRLCDAKLPPRVASAVVRLYVRAYQVDLDEALRENGGFSSFDAFFTRRLRDGARAVCPDPAALVSPSDGRIEAIGRVDLEGRLLIKGREYRVDELLGDAAEARRYDGGQFVVVYLSPRDYHRVHSPVEGEIRSVRSMPGDLYPVNAIGERHVPSLFAKNRRVAIAIDTPARGRVTVVMVGAMIVGRITVSGIDARDVPLGDHVIHPPRPVARGGEIGIFHIGSTAVVFAEPGAGPGWTRRIGPVLYGEPLAEIETGDAAARTSAEGAGGSSTNGKARG